MPKAEDYKVLREAITGEMLKKAEDGWVLTKVGQMKSTGVYMMEFHRDFDVIPNFKRKPEPEYVRAQRDALEQKFPEVVQETIPASRSKETPQADPKGEPLTALTIGERKSGVYSFVQLEGENFLRTTKDGEAQHVEAGGMENAVTAGEIKIVKDEKTDEVTQIMISLKSGTYLPHISKLRPAVEALWRQEIFPKNLLVMRAPISLSTTQRIPPSIVLDLSQP